ncbi:MAG: cytochrome b N-terminal domain-containing protein [Verrucomicrobia bacterium]|nr:cytochrome b N-terminal domain-containing protein [Verrucomicrobiota bacterium]
MSAKDRPIVSSLVNVAMWLERRLHLVKVWKATAGHPIPKSSASWFYVFGSMTLLCFTIQVLTGILLALVYIPSANEAYRSLEYLNYQQELGWFLRGVHYWGSNCMVVVMFFHMTQVFLWGAYKHPRELTWISGAVLLVLTLALSFTGQVMRFDSDAYWGIGIGAAISGRIPIIGAQVVNLLLGGPIIGSDTLSRFFALHVFVLPGAVIALVSLHLRLVLLKGINEYPEPGVQVHKQTYWRDYEETVHKDGMPFVPDGIGKDLVANGLLLIVIVALAVFVGPKGPEIPADPAQVISEAKPDYPFLWLLSAAALLPNGSEIILFFVFPLIAAILLFGLPFYSNVGEKHYSRRPISVLVVILTYLTIGLLTYAGITGPWSPRMEAWSGTPTKPEFIAGRSPVELQGALLLQGKQCRNCHAIGGEGGHRGPDLSAVGTRMDQPELVRQVIQGGGNMPAYGNTLSPQEVSALVSYLVSLRPQNTIPALNPTNPEKTERVSSGELPKQAKVGG